MDRFRVLGIVGFVFTTVCLYFNPGFTGSFALVAKLRLRVECLCVLYKVELFVYCPRLK